LILNVSSYKNENDTVQLLLNNGANVNHANNNGYTALILAVINNKNDTVQILLNNGANVNHANSHGNNNGYTALILAAINNKNDIVQILFIQYSWMKNSRILTQQEYHISILSECSIHLIY